MWKFIISLILHIVTKSFSLDIPHHWEWKSFNLFSAVVPKAGQHEFAP
jgi:hypothetical protein